MRSNKKIKIYLDMDGTIADLYGAQDWLDKILSETKGLFSRLRPLVCEKELLEIFPKEKYQITILTMTPKDVSDDYCSQVIKEKEQWLDKFFPNLQERIYLEYGNDKNLKDSKEGILIDDNEVIRENWYGVAIDPTELW